MTACIISSFSALKDPRVERHKLHSLSGIWFYPFVLLVMTLLAGKPLKTLVKRE